MLQAESSPLGWKPHVVYEFVGVKRQTLVYWRDNLYPKYDKKLFSSFDIIVYKIIKEYVVYRALQMSKIKKVDWIEIAEKLIKLDFDKHKGKILNVNIHTGKHQIYNSIQDFDKDFYQNHYVDISGFSDDVLNGLKYIGLK